MIVTDSPRSVVSLTEDRAPRPAAPHRGDEGHPPPRRSPHTLRAVSPRVRRAQPVPEVSEHNPRGPQVPEQHEASSLHQNAGSSGPMQRFWHTRGPGSPLAKGAAQARPLPH